MGCQGLGFSVWSVVSETTTTWRVCKSASRRSYLQWNPWRPRERPRNKTRRGPVGGSIFYSTLESFVARWTSQLGSRRWAAKMRKRQSNPWCRWRREESWRQPWWAWHTMSAISSETGWRARKGSCNIPCGWRYSGAISSRLYARRKQTVVAWIPAWTQISHQELASLIFSIQDSPNSSEHFTFRRVVNNSTYIENCTCG